MLVCTCDKLKYDHFWHGDRPPAHKVVGKASEGLSRGSISSAVATFGKYCIFILQYATIMPFYLFLDKLRCCVYHHISVYFKAVKIVNTKASLMASMLYSVSSKTPQISSEYILHSLLTLTSVSYSLYQIFAHCSVQELAIQL